MVRELGITLYLLAFRILFIVFKQCPQKKKSTFVASFGDNILFMVKELERQTDEQIVILKTPQCKIELTASNRTVLKFDSLNFINWIQSIYHIATSRNIIVDNYFGFLAVTNFNENVKCIQLWHAAGAIKQFGLKDPSIRNRSDNAKRRFKKVYNRFDYIVTGSDKMAKIFQESFGITENQILRTGIPRTDFFFDTKAKKRAADLIRAKYPSINKKKVILYAPTFRDHELSISNIALDIEKLHNDLSDEYILLFRLHPAVRSNSQYEFPEFIIDVSDYRDVNQLLVVTDILITDYSSIPFEYSLLNKPMIFYAYDLDEYSQSRGFWEPYETMIPGHIAINTSEIIKTIKSENYDMKKIKEFAEEWNEYSKGDSTKCLIKSIYVNTEQSKVFNLIP